MRFFGPVNLILTDAKTRRIVGKFDDKGIFETEDELIIRKLKTRYKFENDTEKCDEKTDKQEQITVKRGRPRK